MLNLSHTAESATRSNWRVRPSAIYLWCNSYTLEIKRLCNLHNKHQIQTSLQRRNHDPCIVQLFARLIIIGSIVKILDGWKKYRKSAIPEKLCTIYCKSGKSPKELWKYWRTIIFIRGEVELPENREIIDKRWDGKTIPKNCKTLGKTVKLLVF